MFLQKISNQIELVAWRDSDNDLLRLKESRFFWKWPIFDQLLKAMNKDCSSGGIYIIRGPRQVGKSCLVKKLACALFETNNFHSAYLLRGDLIDDYKELAEAFTGILENHKDRKNGTGLLFLIDEITFVSGWQRAVKALVDTGMISRSTLVITGSNSYDLKKAAELLPGRRGRGFDSELLPMDFRDFRKYSGIPLFGRDLFHLYLQTGGFPHSINEYISLKSTINSQSVYLSWIKGDILKAGKSDELLKELFGALIQNGAQPAGFDAIRHKTSFGSHNTVREYIEFLESAFVVNQVPFIKPGIWTFNPKKNRKIFFRDPLITRIAMKWPVHKEIADPGNGYLYESVVAEHLKRLGGVRFGYVRNKSEQEIDFYSEDFAIEVKSGKRLASDDLLGLKKIDHPSRYLLYGGDESLQQSGINIMPVWDFLENEKNNSTPRS